MARSAAQYMLELVEAAAAAADATLEAARIKAAQKEAAALDSTVAVERADQAVKKAEKKREQLQSADEAAQKESQAAKRAVEAARKERDEATAALVDAKRTAQPEQPKFQAESELDLMRQQLKAEQTARQEAEAARQEAEAAQQEAEARLAALDGSGQKVPAAAPAMAGAAAARASTSAAAVTSPAATLPSTPDPKATPNLHDLIDEDDGWQKYDAAAWAASSHAKKEPQQGEGAAPKPPRATIHSAPPSKEGGERAPPRWRAGSAFAAGSATGAATGGAGARAQVKRACSVDARAVGQQAPKQQRPATRDLAWARQTAEDALQRVEATKPSVVDRRGGCQAHACQEPHSGGTWCKMHTRWHSKVANGVVSKLVYGMLRSPYLANWQNEDEMEAWRLVVDDAVTSSKQAACLSGKLPDSGELESDVLEEMILDRLKLRAVQGPSKGGRLKGHHVVFRR